ncbi:MAG TPA: hypothetical protein VFN68_09485 [Acidimicrobiales bacterium]|nr:hypothetical protein [Acidimicrobiales bacterium]
MSPDLPGCPDCGCPLRKESLPGTHSYRCQACGGSLEGFSPFRRALAEGVGQHLWVAAAGGPEIRPCPYCSRPMRTPDPGDADFPRGLGICRGCEQVWIPTSAEPWLAERRAAGPTAAPATPAGPTECPNCGAPYEPDPTGRCRYCRAQLAAPPAPVIVIEQPAPATRGTWWDLLGRPL